MQLIVEGKIQDEKDQYDNAFHGLKIKAASRHDVSRAVQNSSGYDKALQ